MTSDASFELGEIAHGGAPVVMVKGELDVSTAPALRDRLDRFCEQGCLLVVVDLRAVSFIDSTALGVLVNGLKRLKSNGGDLRLVLAHPHVRKVFEITGLYEVFTIYPELHTATAAV